MPFFNPLNYNNMIIKINGKTVTLKYTFRAMMIYEKITGESFNPKGLTEIIIYFYSCVLASDKSLDFSFDDFTDYLDDNPEVLGEFSEWLSTVLGVKSHIQGQKSDNEKTTEDPKKD